MKIPEYYPTNYSIVTEISKSVINNSWVSVTVGSEHHNFNIMRKNIYEEELF